METVGERDGPTAVVVVDANGLVSGWGAGGPALLGWTAEETVGRPLVDLLVDPEPGFPDVGDALGSTGPLSAGIVDR